LPDGLPESSKKPDKKGAKYQRRRQEVLDAAAAVIARKGYHGASTTDIAEHLGVAQPSLYYYFKSKDEALQEICRIGTAGYLERLQAILDGPGLTGDKIRAAIRAHIEPVLTIPNYVKSFQRERRYLPENRRREVSRLTGEYDALFREMLERGVVTGELRRSLDCKMAALMLITQCNAVQYYVADEADVAGAAKSIADVFLAGTVNPPPP